MGRKVTKQTFPGGDENRRALMGTPIGDSINAYALKVTRPATDLTSLTIQAESNESSVLNPVEQSILAFRHSFIKPHDTTRSKMPGVREIEEGPLPPDTKKVPLSLEVKSSDERYGFDAVSNEAAKYAPSRATTLLSTPEQSKAIIEDSTLARIHHRYVALLESVELPEDGLKTLEQARAAARLSSTYDNLCKEQSKFGIKPLPKDPRVSIAGRLKTDFYRNRGKDGQPTPPATRRRGRPKKRPMPG